MAMNNDELFEIVRSVWSTVVGIDLVRLPSDETQDDVDSEFCALGWRRVEPGTEASSYPARSHLRVMQRRLCTK